MQRRLPFILSVLCCLLLVLVTGVVSADVELNLALSTLNESAQMNYQDFKADIHVSYNISDAKIDYLAVTIKMQPADVFMTVQLASITKTSVDQIAVIYQRDKAKGWGRIAQDLGIKPGSPEFKALKDGAMGHAEKIKKHSKGNKK